MNHKLNIVIVDDNPQSIALLTYHLQSSPYEIEIKGECKTLDEAVKAINDYNPDLVFLDIELPGENGFELLNKFDEIPFEVIFVTSYNQYAIKAIKFNALDYLLKPIDKEELYLSLEKVKKKLENSSKNNSIEKFSESLKKTHNLFDKLSIPVINGYQFIELNSIMYCKSDINYTIFYLTDKTELVSSKTLKEYEEILSDFNLIRVHKSYIVNIKHVKQFSKKDGGTILMNDNTEIPLSKNKKDTFFNVLGL